MHCAIAGQADCNVAKMEVGDLGVAVIIQQNV